MKAATINNLKDETMQNRQQQQPDQDYSSRPTFKLLAIIESIVSKSQPLLKTRNEKNGVGDAIEALTSLKKALENVKPQMLEYEKTRKPAKVPVNLYDELKDARLALDKAEERKNNLKPNFDAKQNKLRDEVDRLDEAINQLRLDNIGKSAEAIKKENERFNELSDKKSSIAIQQRKLQSKIDAKCCHCIPSCIKDELAQMHDLDEQLESVNKDISQTTVKISELKDDPKLAELTTKLAKVQKTIDDNIDSYPKKASDADAAFEKAEVALATLQDKINNISLTYYQTLSIPAMFELIHISAMFMRFQTTVNAAYDNIVKANPKDHRLHNVDELKGLLVGTEDELRTALAKLICPASGNRNGIRILRTYESLSKEVKDKFTQGDYSHSELMTIIVPERSESVSSSKNVGSFFQARSRGLADSSPRTQGGQEAKPASARS